MQIICSVNQRDKEKFCKIVSYFFFGILYWVRECVCERRVFSLFARVFLLIEQKLFLFCFSRFLFSFCFCLETLDVERRRFAEFFVFRPTVRNCWCGPVRIFGLTFFSQSTDCWLQHNILILLNKVQKRRNKKRVNSVGISQNTRNK